MQIQQAEHAVAAACLRYSGCAVVPHLIANEHHQRYDQRYATNLQQQHTAGLHSQEQGWPATWQAGSAPYQQP